MSVDEFINKKYKLHHSENFDDYMKALGEFATLFFYNSFADFAYSLAH